MRRESRRQHELFFNKGGENGPDISASFKKSQSRTWRQHYVPNSVKPQLRHSKYFAGVRVFDFASRSVTTHIDILRRVGRTINPPRPVRDRLRHRKLGEIYLGRPGGLWRDLSHAIPWDRRAWSHGRTGFDDPALRCRGRRGRGSDRSTRRRNVRLRSRVAIRMMK